MNVRILNVGDFHAPCISQFEIECTALSINTFVSRSFIICLKSFPQTYEASIGKICYLQLPGAPKLC